MCSTPSGTHSASCGRSGAELRGGGPRPKPPTAASFRTSNRDAMRGKRPPVPGVPGSAPSARSHHAEGVEAAWREITTALQVFHPDGQLNAPSVAGARIAQAIPRLSGVDWSKVIRTLQDPRSLMFLERLHRQLQVAEPNPTRRAALVRLWWLRRQRSRGESSSAESGMASMAALVQMQVCAGLGADWAEAYRRVSRVLWATVRASSAVECMNSVIRMHQARHRSLTQPLLDLKRLYWNGCN